MPGISVIPRAIHDRSIDLLSCLDHEPVDDRIRLAAGLGHPAVMGELVLPSALTGRPFTVREARAAGLRYDELRAAPLHAPTWAVRCLEEPGGLSARAAAFARGLPDDVAFSHVTAARLLAAPPALPPRAGGCRPRRHPCLREAADPAPGVPGPPRTGAPRSWSTSTGCGSWGSPTPGWTSARWSGVAWGWTTWWWRVTRWLVSWRCSSSPTPWVHPSRSACRSGQEQPSSARRCTPGSGREGSPCSRRPCPSSGRAHARRWRRGPG